MRIIAALQARVGSTRLPRKALRLVRGKPLAGLVLRRLKACRRIDGIVVATSDLRQDDALERLAHRYKVPCYRGPETDLITRLLGALDSRKADALIRVGGDCPLTDPGLVDRIASAHRKDDGWDVVTNEFPPSYPDGLDMYLLPRRTLERLDTEIRDPLHREWFTAYMLKRPDCFRILNLPHAEDLSGLRWTVDYPEDLAFVRAVFGRLARRGFVFGMQDVLDLLRREPGLVGINKKRVDTCVVGGLRSRAYHELVGGKA